MICYKFNIIFLQVFDAQNLLRSACFVSKPDFTASQLVLRLIEQVKLRSRDAVFKKSTSLALLLLAKVKEYGWTNNHIVSGLLELLGTYPVGSTMSEWVVETIGLVRASWIKRRKLGNEMFFSGVPCVPRPCEG